MTKSTGNEIVDKMSEISIRGNVIPQQWYSTIIRDSGKPYLTAIIILADLVYWYKPIEVRDEQTGQLKEYRKKFAKDKLQRSYQQIADMFGISKREATNAIVFLEKLGVVKREFRTININGVICNNVLFIDLVPEKVKELTYPYLEKETAVTSIKDTYHFKKGEVYTPKSYTNTEITTEITTNNNIKKERKQKKANNENSKTFNEIIESYTDNEDLQFELKEHLKTRKAKKATLTNRSIELSLSRLDKLSDSDTDKIKIVQNAIMNGWTTFYPIKDYEQPKKKQTSYDIDKYEKFSESKYAGFKIGTVY